MSDQPEILITRALSPAKPLQLYIDDERNNCIALFEDENLDSAIGRNGTNINLASKITSYTIDAYGIKQYSRMQEDQKKPLSDIDGVDLKVTNKLVSEGVEVVSDLLDADPETLLKNPNIDDQQLDLLYDSVQFFIEREIKEEGLDDLYDETAELKRGENKIKFDDNSENLHGDSEE